MADCNLFYSFSVKCCNSFLAICEALGFEVPLVDYFFLIPIQFFILMLPSTNGIGLREVSNIFLFRSYGISSNLAVAFWSFGFGNEKYNPANFNSHPRL